MKGSGVLYRELMDRLWTLQEVATGVHSVENVMDVIVREQLLSSIPTILQIVRP